MRPVVVRATNADRAPQAAPEHEFEAEHGLPQALPPGERILWQGAPALRSLARRAFHFHALLLYFALLLAARALTSAAHDGHADEALSAALRLLPLAAAALAVVFTLAWFTVRTTVYTITDRRIVMRVGIVLSVSFNLPFAAIEAADLRRHADGSGDISLALGGGVRIAWLHLWPHTRPWRVRRTEPTLRCVADAEAVARLLATAWSNARGIAARPVAPADERHAGAHPAQPTPAVLAGVRS